MDVTRWVLWGLVALVALVAWNAAWVWGVRRYYRLRAERPTLARVRCADGWELAVHVRPAVRRRFREPVLLCHGLAANRYTFDFEPPYSLAHALAEAGFDCYVVEWRGTGLSRRAPPGRRSTDYSFDDHVRQDAPALLRYALERSGAERALWVGHSMGGLVGYAVAQGPLGQRVAGLATLGSPVFFRYGPFLHAVLRLGVRAAWPFGLRQEWATANLAPFLGYLPLPLSDLMVNPRHIPPRVQRQLSAHMISAVSRRMLLQFQDWIRHDAFRSSDGREDWRAGIARVTAPLLVIGGSQDKLAPPEAVEAQYALAAASEDRTLHVFGRDRGDKMDYGHGDLLFGTGAPTEVYPVLQRWLTAHATALADAEPPAVPLPA